MLSNKVNTYSGNSPDYNSGATSYSHTMSNHNQALAVPVDGNDLGRARTPLFGEYQSKELSPKPNSIVPYSYDSLRVLYRGYSRTQETYRRMAELGASNETYRYALKWVDQLKEVVSSNQLWWNEPLVNLSMESEIVLEWWHENKKVTIYILCNIAQYIKVWGEDIDDEMEDGFAASSDELTELWKWLIS